jgi:hypothetical protein
LPQNGSKASQTVIITLAKRKLDTLIMYVSLHTYFRIYFVLGISKCLLALLLQTWQLRIPIFLHSCQATTRGFETSMPLISSSAQPQQQTFALSTTTANACSRYCISKRNSTPIIQFAANKGDQIGRILGYWVIEHFGHFC